MTRQERIASALVGPGSLFLVMTTPELRRQGMTHLSLYALQRAVEEAEARPGQRYSEQWLRRETGLKDYETSRACTLLVKSDLVTVAKHPGDGRVREFVPTDRGRRVLQRVIEEAGRRLWEGIQPRGRIRRVKQVTDHLRRANRILREDIQLSFFDKDLFPKEPVPRRRKRRARRRSTTAS